MRPSSSATAMPMWTARNRRIAWPWKLALMPGCFVSVSAQARTIRSVTVSFGAPGTACSSSRRATARSIAISTVT